MRHPSRHLILLCLSFAAVLSLLQTAWAAPAPSLTPKVTGLGPTPSGVVITPQLIAPVGVVALSTPAANLVPLQNVGNPPLKIFLIQTQNTFPPRRQNPQAASLTPVKLLYR